MFINMFTGNTDKRKMTSGILAIVSMITDIIQPTISLRSRHMRIWSRQMLIVTIVFMTGKTALENIAQIVYPISSMREKKIIHAMNTPVA